MAPFAGRSDVTSHANATPRPRHGKRFASHLIDVASTRDDLPTMLHRRRRDAGEMQTECPCTPSLTASSFLLGFLVRSEGELRGLHVSPIDSTDILASLLVDL